MILLCQSRPVQNSNFDCQIKNVDLQVFSFLHILFVFMLVYSAQSTKIEQV